MESKNKLNFLKNLHAWKVTFSKKEFKNIPIKT